MLGSSEGCVAHIRSSGATGAPRGTFIALGPLLRGAGDPMLRDWRSWGQSQARLMRTPPPGQEEVDKACSRRLLTAGAGVGGVGD